MEEKNNMPTLEGDKAKIDEFLSGKTSKFDIKAFKRVVLTQLTYDGLIANNKICGFTKEQIAAAIEQLGVSASIRGEALTLEQFAKLADILAQ